MGRSFLHPGKAMLVLAMLVVLATTASRAAAQEAKPASKPPNFLVLLCDDLGYGDLGCFGHPVIKTPNLDRMAADGLKLTRCYSASPVCSPSRAGLFTGRNPNRMGIRDWIPQGSGVFLPRSEVTVAKLLHDAGYRTGLAGKWHLNSRFNGMETTPGDHGFDDWIATQNNAPHLNPGNYVRNRKAAGPLQGADSTIVVDEAIRFIRETQETTKQPFAMFVTFHAPHEKVAVPEEWSARYAAAGDPNKAIYYGAVSLVDHEIGRLLALLDELRLAENTLVLFTSDNGPETLNRYVGAERSHGSPGPLRGMKLHVTEGGYRVPGILRWTGRVKPGQVSDTPVCSLDLLPTFCELAGVKLPADRALDGTSLVPLLSGRPFERKTPLYWQYDVAISRPWQVTLLDGDWKLLADAKLERFELYNIKEDAGELKDRAAAEPERVRRMQAEMRRLHAEINGSP